MQLLYETGSISWSNKCVQANWKTTSQLKRRCHHVTIVGLLFQAPIPLYSTSWVGGKEGGGEGIYHISETFECRGPVNA